jgi:hypothetical protein
VESASRGAAPERPDAGALLSDLERGEMSVDEVLEALRKGKEAR